MASGNIEGWHSLGGNRLLSRRHLLRVVAGSVGAFAATGLLSACGGDDDDDDDSGQANESEATSTVDESNDADDAESTGETDAAATDEASGNPQAGGSLRYSLSTDPPNLNPQVGTGYAAVTVKQQCYSTLVLLTDELEIVPELAESWEQSEDATSFTFKLRSGVTWHDGTPFTADDVKFTIDSILADDSTASAKSDLVTVDSVEVQDDTTVQLILSQSDGMLLNLLAGSECSILSKQYVEGGGDLLETMMGTGPFKVAEREKGVILRLEKNPDFWEQDRPLLDEVIFRPAPDDTARVNALKGGSADIIDYVPWRDQGSLEEDAQYKLYSDSFMTYMWLQFNQSVKPLDDVRVRQAISYGIDREAIVQTVFFGRGEAMTGGPISEDIGGGSSLLGHYARDVEKAKQLLADAGFPDGFEIGLLSTPTYSYHSGVAEVVQASLEEVGVNVKLELVEWASDIERSRTGEFEMQIMGGGFAFPHPGALSASLHSSSSSVQARHSAIPELDELLNQVRSAIQPDEVAYLALKINELILEEVPIIYLATRQQAEASTAQVNGYKHVPGGQFSGVYLRQTWLEQ